MFYDACWYIILKTWSPKSSLILQLHMIKTFHRDSIKVRQPIHPRSSCRLRNHWGIHSCGKNGAGVKRPIRRGLYSGNSTDKISIPNASNVFDPVNRNFFAGQDFIAHELRHFRSVCANTIYFGSAQYTDSFSIIRLDSFYSLPWVVDEVCKGFI